MSTLMVTNDEAPTQALALMEHAPTAVLAAAREAAVALKDVISQKPKKVVMNGEQYLENEDWQTLGRFYGISFREDGDPEFVHFTDESGETVRGFKASALAIDKDGRELSRATAFCLSDEEKWSSRAKYEWHYVLGDGTTTADDPGPGGITWVDNPNKPGKKMPKKEKVRVADERVPLFQLASMAQTRAGSKVLRNVLSWVAVLAGYRPTPAEELDNQTTENDNAPTPARHAAAPPIEAQVVGQREPGGDDAEVPGEPPRARIPGAGAKSWEDPTALGQECLRLTGGVVKSCGDLIAQIAGGTRTCRGMKPDAVRAAWLELAKHATFGIGAAK